MIIIDEEDQSSLMLSMMLASMLRNLLLSRLRTLSICDLSSFALLIMCFRFACVVCDVPLGGCGFPDEAV